MYAVIATGGKQYRVRVGDLLDVERLHRGDGSTVEFTPLLLVDDDGGITRARDVGDVVVSATVLDNHRGAKLRVFTYKNKTRQKRMLGHRQALTRLRVDGIGTAEELQAAAEAAALAAREAAEAAAALEAERAEAAARAAEEAEAAAISAAAEEEPAATTEAAGEESPAAPDVEVDAGSEEDPAAGQGQASDVTAGPGEARAEVAPVGEEPEADSAQGAALGPDRAGQNEEAGDLSADVEPSAEED